MGWELWRQFYKNHFSLKKDQIVTKLLDSELLQFDSNNTKLKYTLHKLS